MLTRRHFLQSTAGCCAAAVVPSPALFAADDAPRIIDTHQHLWDISRQKLPWLKQAPAILNKTYHLQEYNTATRGLNMQAVYMEVHVDPAELIAEAEHVLGLCQAGTHATRAAVIGARPESPDFSAFLKRFEKSPFVKGVRRVLHTPETPAGFCLQETFVQSVRLLGARNKSFDLCLRPTELLDAVRLTERCPDTQFILDHCGNADPKAFDAQLAPAEKRDHSVDDWKRGIDRLAARPNVLCKISGVIARLPQGIGAEGLAPIVNHCLDSFGPDRVVFGSDWPVCLLGRELRTWVTFLTDILRSRPAAEQRQLWSENALRYYSL